MNLEAYLARINYTGATDPTLETLQAIHTAHLLAVPFENLDIHLGRTITLDEAAIFTKLVTERRGGFCYEQNTLFAGVLRALGYTVTLLEARVSRGDGTFGIPFDHMALVVTLGGARWLADVGFGDSFITPLRLDDDGEQSDGRASFRVQHDGMQGIFWRRREGSWWAQYQFFLQARALTDYARGCHYHQTAQETTFTQRRVCSRLTPEGRLTLRAAPGDNYTGASLIITTGNEREELPIPDAAAWHAALRDHFGITLAETGDSVTS